MKNYCPKCGAELGTAGMLGHNCTTPTPPIEKCECPEPNPYPWEKPICSRCGLLTHTTDKGWIPKKQHHKSGGKLYRTFHHMKQRCNNPNNPKFAIYGGKGIKCEWESFEDFARDMEPSFKVHVAKHGEKNTTIDRVDSEGNYSNMNCRWATYAVQNLNRRHGTFVEIGGIKKNLKGWCEHYGIPFTTFNQRMMRGWDMIRAFETPKDTYPVRKGVPRGTKINPTKKKPLEAALETPS